MCSRLSVPLLFLANNQISGEETFMVFNLLSKGIGLFLVTLISIIIFSLFVHM